MLWVPVDRPQPMLSQYCLSIDEIGSFGDPTTVSYLVTMTAEESVEDEHSSGAARSGAPDPPSPGDDREVAASLIGLSSSTVPASDDEQPPAPAKALAKTEETFGVAAPSASSFEEDGEIDTMQDPTLSASSSKKDEEIDFTQDPTREMTYGRRLALYMKEYYSWYYNETLAMAEYYRWYYNENQKKMAGDSSSSTSPEIPSLEKAWAFFEHITLERYIVHKKGSSKHDLAPQEEEVKTSLTSMVIRKVHKGDRKLDIAEPGENHLPTKLYSPLNTPLSQMGDFGLGYGLYFSTLRAFAFLCLLAGVISIPSLMHYASDEYSGEHDVSSALLQGSAICTERTWVPCPTCTREQFTSFGVYEPVRTVESEPIPYAAVKMGEGEGLNITDYMELDEDVPICFETCQDMLRQEFGIVFTWAETYDEEDYYKLPYTENIYPISDYLVTQITSDFDAYIYVEPGYGDTVYQPLGFALKNNCEAPTKAQGFSHWATLLLLVSGTYVIQLRQKKLVVKFDEDEMTAQDYSIAISNPPADAFDPGEWQLFFEGNFEDCKVTVCTVDVDNDGIVNLLMTRRNILRQLEFKLPPGTPKDLETLGWEAEKVSSLPLLSRMLNSVPKLVDDLKDVNTKIADTLDNDKKKYSATKVFVTFETEGAQREVLSKLSVGTLAAMKNDKSAVPLLF